MNFLLARHLFFGFLVFSLVSGCATKTGTYSDGVSAGPLYSKIVNLYYPGEAQPFENVAVVSMDTPLIVRSIKDSKGNLMSASVEKVKRGLYSTGRRQSHFLPGTYTFTVGYYFYDGNVSSSSKEDIVKTISLEKGQARHLNLFFGGRTWSLSDTDGAAALPTMKDDFDQVIKVK